MARTVWGEARGEGIAGMMGVACVIMNRARSEVTWWGNTPRTVCLFPKQFSCLNADDPNLPQLLEVTPANPEFQNCLILADQVLDNSLRDIVGGATHYFDDSISPPKWATPNLLTVKLGRLSFYKGD